MTRVIWRVSFYKDLQRRFLPLYLVLLCFLVFIVAMTESTVAIDPLFGDSSIEAQINPYLFHPSTATATTLVTEQLIGVENYISWSKAMSIALSG